MTREGLAAALRREGSSADAGAVLGRLEEGTYRPARPYLRRRRRPDGAWRTLRVPRPTDMAVQRLAAQLAAPRLDGLLSPGVHGFRAGHSVGTALSHIAGARAEAIVALDIAALFDRLDLLHLRSAPSWLPDRWWRGLLRGQLSSWSPPVPQGAPLSPLLANMVLAEILDRHLDARRLRWIRYADDVVILVARRAGLFPTITWTRGLLNHARLEIRNDKTRILQREPGRTIRVLGRRLGLVHGRVVVR